MKIIDKQEAYLRRIGNPEYMDSILKNKKTYNFIACKVVK